jgi:hypothetical protein
VRLARRVSQSSLGGGTRPERQTQLATRSRHARRRWLVRALRTVREIGGMVEMTNLDKQITSVDPVR